MHQKRLVQATHRTRKARAHQRNKLQRKRHWHTRFHCWTRSYTKDKKTDGGHQKRHKASGNQQPLAPSKKVEKQALKDLQNDDHIVLLPADKGRVTVVMNKTEYINKAILHLQDTNGYLPWESDPTKTTTTRINKRLKILKDEKNLYKSTYNRVSSNDATITKFYGLPKIHKPNMPLRLIVSLPGSPTYQLSKYLTQLLKPPVNFNTFMEHMHDCQIEPDEIMVSFDIVSLFIVIGSDQLREQSQTNYYVITDLGKRV